MCDIKVINIKFNNKTSLIINFCERQNYILLKKDYKLITIIN